MSSDSRKLNRASIGVNASTNTIPASPSGLNARRCVNGRQVFGFISVMSEDGPEISNVFGIGKKEIKIGRGSQNDIRMNARQFSRHHVTIRITEDGESLQVRLSNESAQKNATRVLPYVLPQGNSVVLDNPSVFLLQGRRFKWMENDGEVSADSVEESYGQSIVYLFEETKHQHTLKNVVEHSCQIVSKAQRKSLVDSPIPSPKKRRSSLNVSLQLRKAAHRHNFRSSFQNMQLCSPSNSIAEAEEDNDTDEDGSESKSTLNLMSFSPDPTDPATTLLSPTNPQIISMHNASGNDKSLIDFTSPAPALPGSPTVSNVGMNSSLPKPSNVSLSDEESVSARTSPTPTRRSLRVSGTENKVNPGDTHESDFALENESVLGISALYKTVEENNKTLNVSQAASASDTASASPIKNSESSPRTPGRRSSRRFVEQSPANSICSAMSELNQTAVQDKSVCADDSVNSAVSMTAVSSPSKPVSLDLEECVKLVPAPETPKRMSVRGGSPKISTEFVTPKGPATPSTPSRRSVRVRVSSAVITSDPDDSDFALENESVLGISALYKTVEENNKTLDGSQAASASDASLPIKNNESSPRTPGRRSSRRIVKQSPANSIYSAMSEPNQTAVQEKSVCADDSVSSEVSMMAVSSTSMPASIEECVKSVPASETPNRMSIRSDSPNIYTDVPDETSENPSDQEVMEEDNDTDEDSGETPPGSPSVSNVGMHSPLPNNVSLSEEESVSARASPTPTRRSLRVSSTENKVNPRDTHDADFALENESMLGISALYKTVEENNKTVNVSQAASPFNNNEFCPRTPGRRSSRRFVEQSPANSSICSAMSELNQTAVLDKSVCPENSVSMTVVSSPSKPVSLEKCVKSVPTPGTPKRMSGCTDSPNTYSDVPDETSLNPSDQDLTEETSSEIIVAKAAVSLKKSRVTRRKVESHSPVSEMEQVPASESKRSTRKRKQVEGLEATPQHQAKTDVEIFPKKTVNKAQRESHVDSPIPSPTRRRSSLNVSLQLRKAAHTHNFQSSFQQMPLYSPTNSIAEAEEEDNDTDDDSGEAPAPPGSPSVSNVGMHSPLPINVTFSEEESVSARTSPTPTRRSLRVSGTENKVDPGDTHESDFALENESVLGISALYKTVEENNKTLNVSQAASASDTASASPIKNSESSPRTPGRRSSRRFVEQSPSNSICSAMSELNQTAVLDNSVCADDSVSSAVSMTAVSSPSKPVSLDMEECVKLVPAPETPKRMSVRGGSPKISTEFVTPKGPATPSTPSRRSVRVRVSSAVITSDPDDSDFALENESVLGISALYKTVEENNKTLDGSQAASASDAALPIKNNESSPRTPGRRSSRRFVKQSPASSIYSAMSEPNQTAVQEKSVCADASVSSAVSMMAVSSPSMLVLLAPKRMSGCSDSPSRDVPGETSQNLPDQELTEETSSEVIVAEAAVSQKKSRAIRRKMKSPTPVPQTEQVPAFESKRSTRKRKQVEGMEATPQQEESTDTKILPKRTRGRAVRPNVPDETSQNPSDQELTEETNSEVVVAKAAVSQKERRAPRRRMESPSPVSQTEQVPASESKRSTRKRKQVEGMEATPQQQEKTDAKIPPKRTKGRAVRPNVPDETSQNASGEKVLEETSSEVVVTKADAKVLPKKTRGRVVRLNVPDETSPSLSGQEVAGETNSEAVIAKPDVPPKKSRPIRGRKMESPPHVPQTEQVPASESKRFTRYGKQVEGTEATTQQQEKADEEAENKVQVPPKRARRGAPPTPQTPVPVVTRRARKEEPPTSPAMLIDEAVTKRSVRKRKGEAAENKEGPPSTSNVTEMMLNKEKASPPKKAKGRAVRVKAARESEVDHTCGQAEALVEVSTQTEVLDKIPAVRKGRAQTRRNQTANLTPAAEPETAILKGKKTGKQSKISKTPVEAETPVKQSRTRKVKFAEPQPESQVVAPKLTRLRKKTVEETADMSKPMEVELTGKRTRTQRNKIPTSDAVESNNEPETSKRRLRGMK